MSDNDLDIGINIHESGGGAALVDAMRAKLAAYRVELQNLARFEQEFGGQGKALASSLNIIDDEVHDVVAAYSKMGAAIDVNNAKAVAAFRAESVELRNYLTTVNAATRDIDALGATLGSLTARQFAAEKAVTANQAAATPVAAAGATAAAPIAAAAAAVASSGQTAANPLLAAASAIANAVGKAGALPGTPSAVAPPVPPISPAVVSSAQALNSEINVAIGGFIRMGQLVDTTSAAAVAAFRAEGNALAVNLARLGATDAELGRIGATVAGVEREFGAFGVNVAQGAGEIEKLPAGARRGASALATLSFGLASGGGSARGMAIAAGSAAQAIGQLSSSAALAATATGIGALITVLAIVYELLHKNGEEAKKTGGAFGNLGSLRADQLKILQDANQRNLDATIKQIEAYNQEARTALETYNILGSVTAALAVKHAAAARDRQDALTKEREELFKAATDASSKEAKALEAQGRQEIEKAKVLEVERIKGPAAARRLAADQELANKLAEAALQTGLETDHNAIISGLHRQHAEEIKKIDLDEATQHRALFEKLQTERLDAEAKLGDDTYQIQRDAADRRYEAEKQDIQRDTNLRNDPKGLAQAQSLAAQTHTANLAVIEQDRANQINSIRDDARDKLGGLADDGVDETKIRASYKKQIDVLSAAIASEATKPAVKAAAQQGLDLINALIPEEIAKKKLDQIDNHLTKSLATEEQQITRTNALLAAHAITDQEARVQILDAMTKQRDEVAASIPLLEAQAALIPGNSAELEKIEGLRTKLLQLNLSIAQISDQFYKLKQTAIESSENAITQLLERIPTDLLNQGSALNNINGIRVHLASAQAELNDLLKGPQTQASTQRVTELRGEIQNVNSELGQAKSQLTTWKTLFLDAASAIVKALFDVEARMFAVLFVQKALSLFGAGASGGGGVGSVLQIAGEVGSVLAATGGYIRGPGTATSDSIPARLSDGEYVVQASAVRSLGVGFLDAMNASGAMPGLRARRPGAGYATGGLVSAAENAPGGNNHLTVGLEDGLVARHLESSEGTTTLLKFVEKNSHKLSNLLRR